MLYPRLIYTGRPRLRLCEDILQVENDPENVNFSTVFLYTWPELKLSALFLSSLQEILLALFGVFKKWIVNVTFRARRVERSAVVLVKGRPQFPST
jgi:hypothetical protein